MPERPKELEASRSKRFERRLKVIRRFALKQNAFGASGVDETEGLRVEHEACRLHFWPCVVADVHAFADQGMAELGEVDSNLVLASGLEAAFDQTCARK